MFRPSIRSSDLGRYARDVIASAQALAPAHLTSQHHHPAGLSVTLWHRDAALAEICHRGLAVDSEKPTVGSIVVYAVDPTIAGSPQFARLDVESGFSSSRLDTLLAEEGLRGFFHDETMSWQFFDPSAGVGVLLMSRPTGIPLWETGSPLRLFLHWGLSRHQRRLIHAGTLGNTNTGVLIAGSSGSGKSGTVMAGILNGLKTTGDDYVVVGGDNEVSARPIFKVVKQDPAGVARLGLHSNRLGPVNWQGKFEFDPEQIAVNAFTAEQSLTHILFPRVARLRRSELRPISSREAALRLSPSSVLQLPGDRESGFRHFADLARRLPAFTLDLSEDSLEIVETISSLWTQEIVP